MEDDEAVRKLTIDALELMGYNSIVASDPDEAMILFDRNHHRIDLPSVTQILKQILIALLILANKIVDILAGLITKRIRNGLITKQRLPSFWRT